MTHARATARVDVRPNQNLVRVTFEGALSLESFLHELDRIVEMPAYRPGMSVVHDLRHATVDVPAGRLNHLMSELRRRSEAWGEGWRYAVVVSDALTYGITRMGTFWFDRDAFEIEVFRDPMLAESWARASEEAA